MVKVKVSSNGKVSSSFFRKKLEETSLFQFLLFFWKKSISSGRNLTLCCLICFVLTWLRYWMIFIEWWVDGLIDRIDWLLSIDLTWFVAIQRASHLYCWMGRMIDWLLSIDLTWLIIIYWFVSDQDSGQCINCCNSEGFTPLLLPLYFLLGLKIG